MPGITNISGLKQGTTHHASKHLVIHDGHKIGGTLKAHHLSHHPEIEDEARYGSNLNKLRHSLKSMHIHMLNL